MAIAATTTTPGPKTMFDKIWEAHQVDEGLIYVDLHLVHEVTSPQAFSGLRARGLRVRHPERTVATADHSTPTHPRSLPIADPMAAPARRGRPGPAQPLRSNP